MNSLQLLNKISRPVESIGIWGSVMDGPGTGYGYAGLCMVKTLNKMGISTFWRDDEAPVSISFCQPDLYSQLPGQFKIAYTPWESTKIPNHWLPIINTMDLFWTTSNFCAQVFKDEGVKIPIQVVHHGLKREEWRLKKREIRDKFYFLHIGEPATRKNGQMAVDAFLEKFEGKSDYHLILKANEYVLARRKNPFGSLEGHPQITIITKKYSQLSLELLYHKCHCFIYPSSGEGFGLIPFQAIGTGMPTIMTDWSGLTDFSKYAIPLKYEVVPSNHGWHLGDWAWPNINDLADKMEWVANNYSEASKKALENGEKLGEEFDWDDIFKRALSRFI